MTWVIRAIAGDLIGQEITIDRDMLVGRHQSADMVLQSAEISRKHATYLLREQALWVQDLNSSNGTFVNNERLEVAEVMLKEGDIVQFASLKFSVLAPLKVLEDTVESISATPTPVVETLVQPSEAVAVSETAQTEVPVSTVAQQMNEQGMPELTQRHEGVELSRDGMPQHVAVPKPAPIPEGVDLTSVKPDPVPMPVEQPISHVALEKEQQKNASVGLMSVIAIVILAILAWLFFK